MALWKFANFEHEKYHFLVNFAALLLRALKVSKVVLDEFQSEPSCSRPIINLNQRKGKVFESYEALLSFYCKTELNNLRIYLYFQVHWDQLRAKAIKDIIHSLKTFEGMCLWVRSIVANWGGKVFDSSRGTMKRFVSIVRFSGIMWVSEWRGCSDAVGRMNNN